MKKFFLSAMATAATALLCVGAVQLNNATKVKVNRAERFSNGLATMKALDSRQQAQSRMKAAADNPYTLPFTIEPTDEDVSRVVILDANEDGCSWTKDMLNGASVFRYKYSSSNAGNDWIFIPVSTTVDNTAVSIDYEVRCNTASFVEKIEIGAGADCTPDAMTIVSPTADIATAIFEERTTSATFATAGVNWIGFHAISDADKYFLYLRNISVTEMNGNIPDKPEIASSAIDGAEFTASVTMPSAGVTGQALGALKLRTLVDDVVTGEDVATQAGASVPVSLTLTAGEHTVSFQAVNEVGTEEYVSKAVSVKVRAHVEVVRDLPYSFQPSEDNVANECYIFDVLNDNITWFFDNDKNALAYKYSTLNDADDWVILPPVNIPESGSYKFWLTAWVQSNSYNEQFEVRLGDAPTVEAMTTQVMPVTSINNDSYVDYSGANVGLKEVVFSVPSAGKKYIGIHCVSPKDQYTLYIKDLNLAAMASNVPSAVTGLSADFNGSEGSISFTLPSVDLGGNAIEQQVGAKVMVDNQEYTVVEPKAAGSDVTVPMTLTLGAHTISVSATVGSGESVMESAVESIDVTITNPEGFLYPLPFYMKPEPAELAVFSIIDGNNDGLTWEYYATDQGVRIKWNDNLEADDWLILPAVNLPDATKVYNFSFEAKASYENFPEKFEVKAGKSADPEAMTLTLVEPTEYKTPVYKEVKSSFTVPEAGGYYIAIHGISRRGMAYLLARNFKVEDSGSSAQAPGEPTNIAVAADPTGALKATISFDMPSVMFNGEAIADGTQLTANVSCPSGSGSVTGYPGERKSVTLDAAEGWNVFTLQVSSDKGSSLEAKVNGYVGVDKPVAPEVTGQVTEDNKSLVLTWTAPAVGANGGAVPAGGLSYEIVKLNSDYTLSTIATVTETTFTFTPESSVQADYTIGVRAVNSKGNSTVNGVYGVLGTPYETPAVEDYSAGKIAYSPIIIETPDETYNSQWYFDSPVSQITGMDYDGKALFCIGSQNGEKCRLALPKISTVGVSNAKVEVDLYVYDKMPATDLYLYTFGKDVKLATVDASGLAQGWHTFSYDLPADFTGKKWVNLAIESTFGAYKDVIAIKGWSLRALFDNDFAVSIESPGKMIVGEQYRLNVTARNNSINTKPVVIPTVKVAFGDESLELDAVEPATADMLSGEERLFRFNLVPTADMMGDIVLTAGFADYSDDKDDNNSAEAAATVAAGNKLIVTDLAVTTDADTQTHTFTWTAPEGRMTVTDDMESYTAWSYGSAIGPWKFVDGDGKEVYTIQNGQFDGAGEPKAFQVVTSSIVSPNSGESCLMATCPVSEDEYTTAPDADDWLISPEVPGGSNFSFFMNILTAQYGAETVEVLYSSTTDEPSAFQLIQTITKAQTGWQEFNYTLPDDAKYFAIHYVSNDIFGVLIDDITYQVGSNASAVGYNLYRDGQLVGPAAEGATETTDRPGDAKEHFYNVTVLADDQSEHPFSNTVKVSAFSGLNSVSLSATVSGAQGEIILKGFNGRNVKVYNVAGVCVTDTDVNADLCTIPVAAGVYTVKANGIAAAKVLVR